MEQSRGQRWWPLTRKRLAHPVTSVLSIIVLLALWQAMPRWRSTLADLRPWNRSQRVSFAPDYFAEVTRTPSGFEVYDSLDDHEPSDGTVVGWVSWRCTAISRGFAFPNSSRMSYRIVFLPATGSQPLSQSEQDQIDSAVIARIESVWKDPALGTKLRAHAPDEITVLWSNVVLNCLGAITLGCFLHSLSWVPRFLRARSRRALQAAGRCPNCRYDMRGLTSNRCPECGGESGASRS